MEKLQESEKGKRTLVYLIVRSLQRIGKSREKSLPNVSDSQVKKIRKRRKIPNNFQQNPDTECHMDKASRAKNFVFEPTSPVFPLIL